MEREETQEVMVRQKVEARKEEGKAITTIVETMEEEAMAAEAKEAKVEEKHRELQ